MQNDKRLFKPEELVRLTESTGDRVTRLIREGNLVAARVAAEAHRNAHLQIRQIYAAWNALTLSYIYKNWGYAELVASLRDGLTPGFRPIVETFRNGLTREAVIQIARMWLYNADQFGPMEEDGLTIEFRVSDCGNGWQFDETGRASEPLSDVSLTGNSVPDHFSVFRLANVVFESLMIQWLGYPAFVTDFDTSTGNPSRIRFYKDPSQVPDRYFERAASARDARRIRGAIAVAGGRLFSTAERTSISIRAMDRAIVAIDGSDLDMAMGFAQQSKNEWFPLHHAYRDWITGQLSYIYRQHGVDAVYEAVTRGYNTPIMEPMLDAVAAIDVRTSVEGLAAGFLQHAMQFRIEEDDDRFVFITEPCGSGGRLLDEGAYDAIKGFARIKEKHKAGFFLENFPVYCVHCPTTNEAIFERGGPYYLMVDGDLMTVPDGNCNFYIFKNPDAIPENFYRRAGRKKGDACVSACKSCDVPVQLTGRLATN